MGRKATWFYTQELAEWICEKIYDGYTIAEICRKYSRQVPSEKTLRRWKRSYPEFKKMVDIAYEDLLYAKLDEMLALAEQPLPEGLDRQQQRTELDLRRQRLDSLKFIIANIAPKICKDLKDSPTSTILTPSVNIINYADVSESKTLPLENKLIEHR